MHSVQMALESIQKNSKQMGTPLDINDSDFRLARFADLLHDIGHQPFSHALDKVIGEDHEDYSVAITEERFGHIIEKSSIDVKDVTRLILGKTPLQKPFLASLINSQLDVDKFDYLLRDSHYAGVKYGLFDLDRLIDSLFVVDSELVILDGGYFAAEQLIVARYHMFEQLYYHHTKRAFEGMARKIAINLIENDKLGYPTISDLKDKKLIDEFILCDDAWFLNKIRNKGNAQTKQVAQLIEHRFPYKAIVDSEELRQNMLRLHKDPSESRGFVNALEEDIKFNLRKLGIGEYEILFDTFSSIPYRLRPYRLLYPEDDDPGAVRIYNHKTGSKEPIEEKSIIVDILAKAQLSGHRVYVKRERHKTLHDFLSRKYTKYFGEGT